MANGFKTGGRQAGSCNKITKDIRTLITDLLVKEFEHLHSDLKKLEPKERLELLVKLLPYDTPRFENISFSDLPKSRNEANKLFKRIMKMQPLKQ
jgi:hypothetical protein